MNGGNFWNGFAAGAISSIASSIWQGGNSTEVNAAGDRVGIAGTGMKGIGGTGGASMIAFGTIAGGAGAALTGGNFWQGAVTGLIVSGLNHSLHTTYNKNFIDKRLRKLGKVPDTKADIEQSQLGDFAEDMFPYMMGQSDNPVFRLKDRIISSNGKVAYGQTVATTQNGKSTASHIEISRSALSSWRLLASTIGHEVNHYFFFNSGAYDRWVRHFGEIRADALGEFKSQYWELRFGGVPSIDIMNDNLKIFKTGRL